MPDTKEKLIETYGEVAQALGENARTGRTYSISHVRRLWKRYGFRLKYRLLKRGWIRMTYDELEKFRGRIQESTEG